MDAVFTSHFTSIGQAKKQPILEILTKMHNKVTQIDPPQSLYSCDPPHSLPIASPSRNGQATGKQGVREESQREEKQGREGWLPNAKSQYLQKQQVWVK